jgi:antitoxin (DNA-binding transcriptional repressor) of toxin-antitoxin stability system
MTTTITTEQIKTYLPEAIESALAEDFLVITRHNQPIAALVSYEDLLLLQKIKATFKKSGLAHIADNWEDADDFAQELDKIVAERYQVIAESK